MKNQARLFGFTLVELLVVISIIALLLAVLMPALAKAREQGRKIVCGAHMKEMGLGMQMYAMAYKDFYPAMLMPTKPVTVKIYWHRLALQFANNTKLLRCPSLTVYKHLMSKWDNSTFITGFGLNYNGPTIKTTWAKGDDPDGGFGYVIPEEPRGGCVRNTRVRRAGEFIMLGDVNGNKQTDSITLRANYTYGIIGPPRVFNQVNTAGDMPTIHNNGGNIVFMDGHEQWFKTADLMSDNMLNNWRRGN